MAPDVELREVRNFLATVPPFEDLPPAVLESLPRRATVRYFRRGTAIMSVGRDNNDLFVLRSGAVDIRNDDGVLVERGAAGTCFGSTTLVRGNPSRFDVVAIEDCLALVFERAVFEELGEDEAFSRFFDAQRASRMVDAVATLQLSDTGSAILKTTVDEVMSPANVTVSPDETIRNCAKAMTEGRVSSALVTRDDRVIGIVTDRDLRTRVVAAGLDPQTPVRQVMTPDPATGTADSLVFEAMLTMVDRDIHHLPVLDGDRLAGMLTTTDLVRLERANPVFLTGDIARAETVEAVAAVAKRISGVVEGLVRQDASAHDIGRAVTAIGDAVDRRVIALAETELGPPPVPYCWVVLGSRARFEQGLSADQDNALILDDAYRPEHEAYFTALSTKVVDGLEACGYPRCPGDVMATNPRWRVPVSQWLREFDQWMHEPVPKAILQGSIFFDMRGVHGETGLYARLQDHVRSQAPQSHRFLAHLANHAIGNEPPLGFFRNLVVAQKGEHKDTLDIKAGGVRPVVEFARVHALSLGSGQVNTTARLREAIAARKVHKYHGADLIDAFEFVSYVRLRHQAAQVREGVEPDDFVAPTGLSSFDQRHLREAFGIIRRAQGALAQRFPTSFMR